MDSTQLNPKANDYYSRLGVSVDASKSDIRKAGKRASKKFHPDNNDSPNAKKQYHLIKAAKDTLGDEQSRKEYDIFYSKVNPSIATELYEKWKRVSKPHTPEYWIETEHTPTENNSRSEEDTSEPTPDSSDDSTETPSNSTDEKDSSDPTGHHRNRPKFDGLDGLFDETEDTPSEQRDSFDDDTSEQTPDPSDGYTTPTGTPSDNTTGKEDSDGDSPTGYNDNRPKNDRMDRLYDESSEERTGETSPTSVTDIRLDNGDLWYISHNIDNPTIAGEKGSVVYDADTDELIISGVFENSVSIDFDTGHATVPDKKTPFVSNFLDALSARLDREAGTLYLRCQIGSAPEVEITLDGSVEEKIQSEGESDSDTTSTSYDTGDRKGNPNKRDSRNRNIEVNDTPKTDTTETSTTSDESQLIDAKSYLHKLARYMLFIGMGAGGGYVMVLSGVIEFPTYLLLTIFIAVVFIAMGCAVIVGGAIVSLFSTLGLVDINTD